jgi:hypothetical protein
MKNIRVKQETRQAKVILTISSLFFVFLYLLTYFNHTGSFDTSTGSVQT